MDRLLLHDPWWLAAIALVPLLVWLAWRALPAALQFPTVEGLQRMAPWHRVGWHHLPLAVRALALMLIVIGLARPQQGLEQSCVRAEGIDIILVVDVSTSMLAEDFQLHGQRVNRLAVVKDVVKEFVAGRPNDRIGLIVFAGRPYTQCPLTLDHGWLLSQLERVQIGMVEDGTAIGTAIATGLNRLRRSHAKSRVMVLLTDGVNNAGTLTPEAATELAKTLGIKIYPIGAGTKGLAPYPARDLFGRTIYQPVKIEVDDERLTKIAQTTGGLYFRATDTDSLRNIYSQIDRLEKTTIEQPRYLNYREWYSALVIPALLLLLAELVLSQWAVRVLP